MSDLFLFSFICIINERLLKKEATENRMKISRPFKDKFNAKIKTKLVPKTIMLATKAKLSKSHCSNFFI